MPWAIEDVDRFRKGLTDSQKKKWIAIANRVLRDLMAKGSPDAEGVAVRTASARFQEELRIRQRGTGTFDRLEVTPLLEERGVTAIVGKRKDGTKAIQSLVFDPTLWDLREAKAWALEFEDSIKKWPEATVGDSERDLREDVHRFTKPRRIDREKGVIEDVLILGKKSANGNIYTDDALDRALPLYEGIKVNLNHPRGSATSPRFVEERFGKFVNATKQADGLHADLHYNPEHPMGKTVAWFAENMPDAIGPSHNAVGKGQQKGSEFIVESIAKVHHVDIVADPATTKGLFEEKGAEQGQIPASFAELIEILNRSKEPAKGAEADAGRTKETKEAQEGLDMDWEDITLDDLKKKRKDLVESILNEQKSSEEQKALLEERKSLKTENDSLKAEKAITAKRAKIVALVESAKLPKEVVSEVFLEQLVGAADDATMTKLLEDRKAIAFASKPKSKATGTAFSGEMDAKSFASAVR